MSKITKKLYKQVPNRREIKKLYLSSFPKEERLPWWVLRLLTIRKGTNITAYYENDLFCGFTYDITEGDILFVMFFAVAGEIRGKGYGSAILDYLKNSHPDKEIMLHIEPLDETADNYPDRKRRFNFYQNNGFFDTEYDVDEVGGTFYVLSTTPTFDEKSYLQVFRKMSFGLWQPVLRKRQSN